MSTERPEAVEAGFAKVVGVEKQSILAMMEKTLKEKRELPRISPYGDGAAAIRIKEILRHEALQ